MLILLKADQSRRIKEIIYMNSVGNVRIASKKNKMPTNQEG